MCEEGVSDFALAYSCVYQGELHVVFQHYTPTGMPVTDMAIFQSSGADVTSGGKPGKRKKNEAEDPPFSSIEVTILSISCLSLE